MNKKYLNKYGLLLSAILLTASLSTATYAHHTYGFKLCKQSQYHCVKVKRGDSWHSLFPNSRDREIVKKVNRTNQSLTSGSVIAVPNNLYTTDFLSLAPFPHQISPQGSKLIKVDLGNLAWGAYDMSGRLVNWGPVSGGKSYCPDIGRGCTTVTGTFKVYRKQGSGCKSSRFPRPNGGAPMPYCMHFHGGYALHGSATVPGYNASHGCVRMFTEDAQWLNQNFVNVGRTIVQVFR